MPMLLSSWTFARPVSDIHNQSDIRPQGHCPEGVARMHTRVAEMIVWCRRHLLPGLVLLTLMSSAAVQAAQSQDAVASWPPVLRGPIVGLAVDGQGDRYVVGSFYTSQDFDPRPGHTDVHAPIGNSDAFITCIAADGSYRWTQTVGCVISNTSALAVTVSAGIVYVTGSFSGSSLGIGGPGNASSGAYTTSSYVAALDANTGIPEYSFGDNGIQVVVSSQYCQPTAVAVAAGTVYVSGNSGGSDLGIGTENLGFSSQVVFRSGSYAFIAAMDAVSGMGVSSFGYSGVQAIDASVANLYGTGLAVNGDTLYLAGNLNVYGTTSDVTVGNSIGTTANAGSYAFVVALNASTGFPSDTFGTSGFTLIGSAHTSDMAQAQGIAVGGGNVYVVGGMRGGSMGILPSGSLASLAGSEDAYIAALDGTSGLALTGFGSGGVQLIGGSLTDDACAVVVSGGVAYITGLFASVDFGISTSGSVQSNGSDNAFICAVDGSSGTAIQSFASAGIQTFGGSSTDIGYAIAINQSVVSVAGFLSSADAGLGGLGSWSSANAFNGFLIDIAATSGTPGSTPITFAAIPPQLVGAPALTLQITPGSPGNALSIYSSNPAVATVSGSVVTIIGAGTTQIIATQAPGGGYPGLSATQELTVVPDAVTPTWPPILKQPVTGMAVDGTGNQYLIGNFESSQDFDPRAGKADIHLCVGNQDAYVTCISSAGTYQWTQTFDVPASSASAMSITTANGIVYVSGIFEGSSLGIGGHNFITTPNQTEAVYIAALDAATGQAIDAFGTKGLQVCSASASGFGSGSCSMASNSSFTDGTHVFLCGNFYGQTMSIGSVQTATFTNSSSRVFLASLDALSGIPAVEFGNAGMQVISGGPETSGYQYAQETGMSVSQSSIYVIGIFSGTGLSIGSQPPTLGSSNTYSTSFIASMSTESAAPNVGFGVGGVTSLVFNSYSNTSALAAGNGTLYVTGIAEGQLYQLGNNGTWLPDGFTSANVEQTYVIALNAITGNITTGFGDSGIQSLTVSAGACQSESLCLSQGLVLLSGQYSGVNLGIGGTGTSNSVLGSSDAYAAALDAATGQPVAAFGHAGIHTLGGSGYDNAVAIAATSTGVFLAGSTSSQDIALDDGSPQWFSSQNGGFLMTLPFPGSTTTGSSQSIHFPPIRPQVVGMPPFALTITPGASQSPLVITSSNPSVATVSGTQVTILGVGSTLIFASQAAGNGYLATSAEQVLTVGQDGVSADWPPMLHGQITSVAIDGSGNHYILGSFFGTEDFDPRPGHVDIESSPTNQSAAYITCIDALEHYQWTRVLSGNQLSATAIVAGGGGIYILGTTAEGDMTFDNVSYASPPQAGAGQAAFIMAFDPASGSLVSGFGMGGIQIIESDEYAFANSMIYSAGEIYATGTYSGNQLGIGDLGTVDNTGSSNVFIAAVDAQTGLAESSFGQNGLQIIGGSGQCYVRGLTSNATSIFVLGENYSSNIGIGGISAYSPQNDNAVFVAALDAASGAAEIDFGNAGFQWLTPQGNIYPTGIAALDAGVYVLGTVSGNVLTIGGGSTIQVRPAGSNIMGGLAFIASLDSATGVVLSAFGNQGCQVFDSSVLSQQSYVYCSGIAANAGAVYVCGTFQGEDLSLSGVGKLFNHGNANAFVAAMDSNSGLGLSSFGTQGLQSIGGNDYDSAQGIALNGQTVSVVGSIGSTNAGIGGLGSLSAVNGFDGYLIDLSAATGTGTTPTTQTILFPPMAPQAVGVPPYSLTITANGSGSPLVVVSTNPSVANVVNGVVTILSPGSTQIIATQVAGNGFTAAVATQVLMVVPDAVTQEWPPVLCAPVQAVTLDSSGNRYVVGSFYQTLDFDPRAGSYDVHRLLGSSDAYVTRIDADGTYRWTQTIDGSRSTSASSVAVVAGTVYITGSFTGSDLGIAGAGTTNCLGGSNVYIAALNSATGSAVAGFGRQGLQVIQGSGYDTAAAICGNSSAIYAIGSFMSPSITIDGTHSLFNGGSAGNCFIIALDPLTGALKTAFGSNGLQGLVGQTSVSAGGATLAGGIVYVTGSVSTGSFGTPSTTSWSTVANSAYLLALDADSGVPVPTFGNTGLVLINGSSVSGYSVAVSGNNLYAMGSFSGGTLQSGIGAQVTLPNGNQGAFIAELNSQTGSLVPGFASSGFQVVTDYGYLVPASLAVSNGDVYLEGTFQGQVPAVGMLMAGTNLPYSSMFTAAMDASTGAAISTFGTDGILTLGGSSGYCQGMGIAANANAISITGMLQCQNAGLDGGGIWSSQNQTGGFLVTLSPAGSLPAVVTVSDSLAIYDGNLHTCAVSTTPPGLQLQVQYSLAGQPIPPFGTPGASTPPIYPGAYTVSARVIAPGYAGTGSGTLTISDAAVQVQLSNLSQIYSGSPEGVTASTQPAGFPLTITYNGQATPPTNAGSYQVVASVNQSGIEAAANGTLVIAPAAQHLTWGEVSSVIYGTNLLLSATADSGLPVTLAILQGSGRLLADDRTLEPADQGIITVQASQAGDGNHVPITSQQAITVAVNPVLTGGPSYPPPGGVTFARSGNGMGSAGGETFTFSGFNAMGPTPLFWGSQPNGIAAAFDGDGSSFAPQEIMAFIADPLLQAQGVAVWNGHTTLHYCPDGTNFIDQEVATRFTLTVTDGNLQPIALSNADGYGLTGIGALVPVASQAAVVNANGEFDALSPMDGQWYAMSDLFTMLMTDPNDTGHNQDFESFSGGFYFPRVVPILSWPNLPPVQAGSTVDQLFLASATYGGVAIDGTYSYTPAPGTILSAGLAQPISVVFTPTDPLAYTVASVSDATTYDVPQAPPTFASSPIVVTYSAAPQVVVTQPSAGVTISYQPYTGDPSQGGTPVLVGGIPIPATTTPPKDVGWYQVVATLNGATALDGLQITSALLTISAAPQSVVYGSVPSAFTPTFTGFLGSDGAQVLSGTVGFSSAVVAGSPVGSYLISVDVSGVSAANYTVAGHPGTIMVTAPGTQTWMGLGCQGSQPASLNGVTAIAASLETSVALRSDGTVVAWGDAPLGATAIPAGLGRVTAIAAGWRHTLALRQDGTVMAWGDNNFGQTSVPTNLGQVIAIAAGFDYSAALCADGTVVVWGSNEQGILDIPQNLQGVTAIAGGTQHLLALQADGTVVGWGSNGYGQCSVPNGLNGVTAIAAGITHSLALKQDGTVVAWGNNDSGESSIPGSLGPVRAISAGFNTSAVVLVDGTPMVWGNASGGITTLPSGLVSVSAVSLGNQFGLAITTSGHVVTWGFNTEGDVGPASLQGVAAISPSYDFSLALRSDGTVFGWGDNQFGQTSPPPGLSSVTAISTGFNFSEALRSDGTVVAWGDNSLGETTIPSSVANVTALATGYYHTIALRSDGTVVTWGYLNSPALQVPTDLKNVVAIAAGGYFSAALTADGSVVVWGDDTEGLIYGAESLTDIVAIAAGANNMTALRADGTIVSWGYTENVNPPTTVDPVVQIGAGWYSGVALENTGLIVAWGDDSYGQTNLTNAPNAPMAMAIGGYQSWLMVPARPRNPLSFSNLVAAYTGASETVTVGSANGRMPTSTTYDGSFVPPSAVGSYVVHSEADYLDSYDSGSTIFTIVPALTLPALTQTTYSGMPQAVSPGILGASTANVVVSYQAYSGDPGAGGTLIGVSSLTPPTAAGWYQVSAVLAGNTAIPPVVGELTITPAPLIISVLTQTKTYDGQLGTDLNGMTIFNADPAAGWVAISGLLGMDDWQSLSGTLLMSRTSMAEDVGTYTNDLTASGLSSPNYVISYQPGTFIITPALSVITLPGAPVEVTYTGLPQMVPVSATVGTPSVTYEAYTSDPFAGGQSAMSNYNNSSNGTPVDALSSATDAGWYLVKASVSGNFSGMASTSLHILPAPLLVTANPQAKVYDKTLATDLGGVTSFSPDPAQSWVNYSGFVNGQNWNVLQGNLSLTRLSSNEQAGVYPDDLHPAGLTANSSSLIGFVTGSYWRWISTWFGGGYYQIYYYSIPEYRQVANYVIAYQNGPFTISPAPITVITREASAAINAPIPPFSALILGLVPGDAPATIAASLSYSCAGIDGSPPGAYPITATLGAGTNYTIGSEPSQGNLVIHDSANFNLQRDFSALSNPTGVWSYGWSLVPGSDFTTFDSESAYLNAYNLDTWSSSSIAAVTQQALPAVWSNQTGTVQGAIGPGWEPGSWAPQSVNLNPGPAADGTPASAVVRFTAPVTGTYVVSGAIANDNLAYGSSNQIWHNGVLVVSNGLVADSQSASLSFAVDMQAGDVLDFSTSDAFGSQYQDSVSLAADITLLPSPTMAINAPLTPIVYGTPLDASILHATVSFQGAAASGYVTYDPGFATVLPVGTTQVSAIFEPTPGSPYGFVIGSIPVTVSPAPLSLVARNASRVVGADNPPFSAYALGLVNNDTMASLSGTASFFCSADASSPIGNYAITPGGLTSSNYQIVPIAGNLAVHAATDWDLHRDFSAVTALNGAWSYGSLTSAEGAILVPFYQDTLLSQVIDCWQSQATALGQGPSVECNESTSPQDTGFGLTVDPGVVAIRAGSLSSPDRYGVVQWQAPATGLYQLDYTIIGVEQPGLDVALIHVSGSLFTTVAGGGGQGFWNGVDGSGRPQATGSQILAVQAGDALQIITGPHVGSPNDLEVSWHITALSGPGLQWQTPLPISYRTPLSTLQLDATHVAPGTLIYSPGAGTLLAAGDHTLTATYTPPVGSGYAPGSITTVLSVAPAPLQVMAPSLTITQGQPLPALGSYVATFSGFIPGEGPASLASGPVFACSATTSAVVGVFAITASGVVDPNYLCSYVPGVLTIQAPGNDAFANASVLSGTVASAQAWNLGATRQVGEPKIVGNSGGRSLWWRWTPQASGMVTISTAGSSFHTLLGVYTGSAVNALTLIKAANSGTSTSSVTFPAIANTTYSIVVDGVNGASGTIMLSLLQLPYPANDAFANAQPLTASSGLVMGTTVGATRETGEPKLASNAGGASVWYSYVVPSGGGILSLTAQGQQTSFLPLLAIYSGTTVSKLTSKASNNSGTSTSMVSVWLPAGTYAIWIDSNNAVAGVLSLEWQFTAAPGNDAFANAVAITGNGSIAGTTLAASKEPGEPKLASNAGGASVWYSYVVPAGGGNISITATGVSAGFNPLLAIASGTSVAKLTVKASADSGNAVSTVNLRLPAGTYAISVDSENAVEGAFTLAWVFQPAPANDNFVSAILVTSNVGSLGGSTVAASRETGEPKLASNPGGASVWYAFIVPAAGGQLQLSVSGQTTGFNPLLALYSGSAVAALTRKAFNDSGTSTSQCSVRLPMGTYAICVDSENAVQGAFTLSWNFITAPTNDNLANAIDFFNAVPAVMAGSLASSNVGASSEVNEPSHAGKAASASVWWRMTPTRNGTMTIATTGSAFTTVLEVYTSTTGATATMSSLKAVVSDQVGTTLTGHVTFAASANTTYWVVVDGVAGVTGNIAFAWNFLVNDDVANAISLSAIGLLGSTTGSNVDATLQKGELLPALNPNGGATVWWSFTAPSNGYLELDTFGSDFDTVLAVYTQKKGSTSVATLSLLVDDSVVLYNNTVESHQSQVDVPVSSGVTYYISVDGFDDDMGSIELDWLFSQGG